MNKEAYEDNILSIAHTMEQENCIQSGEKLQDKCISIFWCLENQCNVGKLHLVLYCKLAVTLIRDMLVEKYALKTAPSLLKLKKKFANSKLYLIEQHPDEWITELKSLRNEMDNIHILAAMAEIDFMIHILNNLPEQYDVVLDGMESRLILDDLDQNKLTVEEI